MDRKQSRFARQVRRRRAWADAQARRRAAVRYSRRRDPAGLTVRQWFALLTGRKEDNDE